MFDIDALTTALLILAAIAAVLVLTWAIGAGDPTDLGLLFGRPWEPAWPRGVQEEEPQPWRFELLDRRRTTPTRLPRAESPARVPKDRAA